ncbi:MAG: class I SAM-dependent methyltransferase [Caldilineaceae bacterium]|nr:class I SAM-dependent methyltransferase [Caldilineaceae bacterium]
MDSPKGADGFNYTRFYGAIAPVYGLGLALLPVWRHYTQSVLPWLPPRDRVLEIGPGPGVLLTRLSRRDDTVVGLDLSPEMLGECRQRLQRAGLPQHLVNANAGQLPLASATFDAVVLTFAFSAFPDGAGVLAEIARVLRPGGVVALVDACLPSDGNWAGVQLAHLWERFGDFMRDEAALMRAIGLEIVECKEFGVFNSVRLTVGQK